MPDTSDLLAEVKAHAQNRRGCHTRKWIEGQPPKVTEVVKAALADPEINVSTIARYMKSLGCPLHEQSLIRHLNGRCGDPACQ